MGFGNTCTHDAGERIALDFDGHHVQQPGFCGEANNVLAGLALLVVVVEGGQVVRVVQGRHTFLEGHAVMVDDVLSRLLRVPSELHS